MDINSALDILERFDFFQGQRAGRLLWQSKNFEVQEQDIADFSRDVALLKNFVKELTEENERLLTRNFDLAEKGEKVVIAYKKLSEENARLSFFNEEKAEAVRYEAITKYKKSIIDYYNNDSRYDRPNAHTLLTRLFALLDEKAKEMLEGEK